MTETIYQVIRRLVVDDGSDDEGPAAVAELEAATGRALALFPQGAGHG